MSCQKGKRLTCQRCGKTTRLIDPSGYGTDMIRCLDPHCGGKMVKGQVF